MEQMKKLTDKITGVKKLRKDQLVVMILCGILLCVVALPVKQKDSASSGSKSNISDRNSATIGKSAQASEESDSVWQGDVAESFSYTAYWEDKLKGSLSRIEGDGCGRRQPDNFREPSGRSDGIYGECGRTERALCAESDTACRRRSRCYCAGGRLRNCKTEYY